ncbi:sugar ABC transporter ATP-binding protein [Kyrpidia spormannii]|uniref:Sugar ABC transporter ATP-binding protein n=1 Tax=Kyrpidia spormannii TaxID=2055160 RepID=A0A2K8N6Y1_9BACL|nr:ATP-binding cassette domain-containing protein [Kyrpidia spormannii]ATY85121.1 sugar ABC transporter ATP-binding protein [Kyrpidia spormannii]
MEKERRQGSPQKPLLRVEHLRKSFGAVQALHDVSLEVWPGEVVALVGDNGAGKSTTVKIISGVERPDGGKIFVDGRRVTLSGPADAERLGIQTVYQDLALCDNLDIVSNLFLGRERTRPVIPRLLHVLRKAEMEEAAIPVLQKLGIRLPPLSTPVSRLSGGQRQTVAVARAVLWGSNIVLLDEPTAALGVAQTRAVLDLIVRLAGEGVGVMVISHNLHDVFQIAHRIVVLRLGRTAATFLKENTSPEEVVAAITGAAVEVAGK